MDTWQFLFLFGQRVLKKCVREEMIDVLEMLRLYLSSPPLVSWSVFQRYCVNVVLETYQFIPIQVSSLFQDDYTLILLRPHSKSLQCKPLSRIQSLTGLQVKMMAVGQRNRRICPHGNDAVRRASRPRTLRAPVPSRRPLKKSGNDL